MAFLIDNTVQWFADSLEHECSEQDVIVITHSDFRRFITPVKTENKQTIEIGQWRRAFKNVFL